MNRACIVLAGLVAATVHGAVPPIGPDFRPEPQKGVCLQHNHSMERGYGGRESVRSMERIRDLGANAVSLSPIGYSFNLHDPRIFGYGGEEPTMTPDRVRQAIRDAHEAGLRVFLNPHIWIGMYGAPGEWRGDIDMPDDKAWDEWFRNYETFILFWAEVAREEGVELFSVGSELAVATRKHPERWRELIRKVRAVYPGPCTYAANWSGEYERIPFWDELEYIAISAYFPIGTGSLDERLARARDTRDALERFAAEKNKPLFFAEAGFRSVAGAGENPASWQDKALPVPDFEEQRLCFETLAETYRGQSWFFGVYWWGWFSDPDFRPLLETDYLFRDKPAEKVVREFFESM